MRWVPFILVAVLAVLVQVTLLRLAVFGDAFPDLLVALVVTFSLGVGPAEGFAAGAVLGLGRDLFTIGPLGLATGQDGFNCDFHAIRHPSRGLYLVDTGIAPLVEKGNTFAKFLAIKG